MTIKTHIFKFILILAFAHVPSLVINAQECRELLAEAEEVRVKHISPFATFTSRGTAKCSITRFYRVFDRNNSKRIRAYYIANTVTRTGVADAAQLIDHYASSDSCRHVEASLRALQKIEVPEPYIPPIRQSGGLTLVGLDGVKHVVSFKDTSLEDGQLYYGGSLKFSGWSDQHPQLSAWAQKWPNRLLKCSDTDLELD